MLPAYFSSQVLQIFETKWGRLKNQITDKTECYRNYNHFNLSTHSLMPYWQRAIESIFPRVFITQFLPVWLTWWNYGLSAKKVINGKKKLVHNFSSFFLFLISGFTSVAEVATVLAKVFMCASILMLVALTWERHFAICSPHQYRIHIRTTPRWRHLCRYFIPVMLCSILFNIPTFINIEVCPALALLHFLYTILKKSKISKKVLRRYLRSKITLFLVN